VITDIEDYFAKGCGRCARFATSECAVRGWQPGLVALRALCRQAGLVETVKWGHPCYAHAGRNIAIIGAFRADFRLSLFNASLMQDPDGILEKQGQNTQHPDMIRFTDSARVSALAPRILAYLQEAIDYADAGVRPARQVADMVLPDELIEALDCDPDLAEAFRRLTPGRQRSYVIHLASAKTAATRVARIAKARGRILAGKGANEY
jgi:uncharacterized protein YdeI (YjbR/CyaY-like superfamily)